LIIAKVERRRVKVIKEEGEKREENKEGGKRER
jgi:hypothetical protein